MSVMILVMKFETNWEMYVGVADMYLLIMILGQLN